MGMASTALHWGLAHLSDLLSHQYPPYLLCLPTQLCPTLCDPMDCSPEGFSVLGISQERIMEWIAISFSRGIFPSQGSTQGLNLCLLHWQVDAWPQRHQGSQKYSQLSLVFCLKWTAREPLKVENITADDVPGITVELLLMTEFIIKTHFSILPFPL